MMIKCHLRDALPGIIRNKSLALNAEKKGIVLYVTEKKIPGR